MFEDEGLQDQPVQALVRAVDGVLGEDPVLLDGAVAAARTRLLLVQVERLQAAVLAAVRDVDARELWALDGAGSARGWLRQQLPGEGGRLLRARQLAGRPHAQAALADGTLSVDAASVVCAALTALPDQVADHQLLGVLVHGVPDLLSSWTGGLVLDDLVTPELLARRDHATAVLAGCVRDDLDAPAARLEPAFVLLAQVLSPAHLPGALRMLVDALLPEQHAERERDSWDDRSVRLRKQLAGGWDLRAHLDDETGQRLYDLLQARLTRRPDPGATPGEDASADEAAGGEVAGDDAGATEGADEAPGGPEGGQDPSGVEAAGGAEADEDGRAGESAGQEAAGVAADEDATAVQPAGDAADARANDGGDARRPNGGGTTDFPAEAAVPPEDDRRSASQLLYDALAALLADASTVPPGTGEHRPAELLIVATLGAVEGRLGVLPGTLSTPAAPHSAPAALPVDTVRRLGCTSTLTAVLLDALGNPVGASGTHRHATARERRALRARWGPHCAVAGCTSPGAVPHHVDPWWHSHRTHLPDLIPICPHHHHDVHEGHASLRLRDGRTITPTGWATSAVAAAAA